MKLLKSIKLALQVFPNSFINRNNEVILIPKFNVYIQLDDVKTNEDFKVKLCEWLSRDCSCVLRYSRDKRLIRYWQDNTNLGNGIKHDLTRQFVRNGFGLFVIEKFVITRELQEGNN